MTDALATLSLAVGVLGSIGGFAYAYLERAKSHAKKEYAAQREFAHLQNNYKTLSSAIAEIGKTLDRVENRQERIERLLENLGAKDVRG